MSLYDDLDIDKEETGTGKAVVAGWSSNYKLMKSQLQAKKASVSQPKPSRRSGGAQHLAPVVDLKRTTDSCDGPVRFNMLTGKSLGILDVPGLINNCNKLKRNVLRHCGKSTNLLCTHIQIENIRKERERETSSPVSLGGSPFIASEPMPSLTGVKDEYNPLRPNDYEEMTKRRKEKREEEDRKRDRDEEDKKRKKREREKDKDVGEMERARRHREEEDEYDRPIRRKSDMGAAIAPPTALLEESPIRSTDEYEVNIPTSMVAGTGLSIASKIMAKYGYREGQGLGKSEQGMSTALFVEKTSKRGGKIIHERDLPKDTPRELSTAATNANLLRNPTKVILLRNMVGPGEVDEDLEGETFEECGKYGKVNKCVIFEMPEAEDEEAVRIYIEFDRIDSAIKAIIDLNGRYFGGRVVQACFYNLDKFRRLDLAAEIDGPP